jgi:Fe-S cluster assembly ATP-binding protein
MSGSPAAKEAQRNLSDGDAGASSRSSTTDSGLDIDALRTVAKGVNELRAPDRATVMITHYKRLLDYVVPDRVHVLQDGRIIQSGDETLAAELERSGYGTFGEQPDAA